METEREISIGDPGMVAVGPALPGPKWPQFEDVVRRIETPKPYKERTLADEAKDQTVSMGRIAQALNDFVEWTLEKEQYERFIAEQRWNLVQSLAYWVKASVVAQAVALGIVLMTLILK